MTAPLSIVPSANRVCDDWIETFLEYRKGSESPSYIHFWTAVSTIAGALRRRVWIPEDGYDYTPNCYIIFVGPPSVIKKSTSINAGMRLLKKVLPPERFGPQSCTWQALAKTMSETAGEVLHIPGVAPHMTSCLTVDTDELGNFFRADDKELADFLNKAWDGHKGPFRRTTMGGGTTVIETPCLNLISATTPSWLSVNFTQELLTGGFGSRTIFVHASERARTVAYPSRQSREQPLEETADALVHDLRLIAQLAGKFHLTSEAYDFGEKWYDEQLSLADTMIRGTNLEGWYARKQAHLHKLAMVLSVSRRNDLLITDKDMIHASKCLELVEDHLLHVYNSVGIPASAKAVTLILDTIKRAGKVHARDLYERHKTLDPQHQVNALRKLIGDGLITQEPAPDGGRFFIYRR